MATSSLTPPTDAELLGASSDAAAAFAELFDRHFRSVYRFLARRVGPDKAEDLSADVFTIALRQRSQFVPIHSSALPWLYGIANNLVARQRRDEKRFLRAQRGRVTDQYATLAENEVVSRADVERVWPQVAKALEKLSNEERDALLLFVWADLRYEDIARVTDVPLGTVRSRISRARDRMRKEISSWNPMEN